MQWKLDFKCKDFKIDMQNVCRIHMNHLWVKNPSSLLLHLYKAFISIYLVYILYKNILKRVS